MVQISHSVLEDETVSGQKTTTWRKQTFDANELWVRMAKKLASGTELQGQHYWKTRVPIALKPRHYIGTSQIVRIVPRHIDEVIDDYASWDGFSGGADEMLQTLEELDDKQEHFWQIFYIPQWAGRQAQAEATRRAETIPPPHRPSIQTVLSEQMEIKGARG